MKKTSYKTNSWWNHRMVNGMNPNRNIDTWEDKEQDRILQKLESQSSNRTVSKTSKTKKNNGKV